MSHPAFVPHPTAISRKKHKDQEDKANLVRKVKQKKFESLRNTGTASFHADPGFLVFVANVIANAVASMQSQTHDILLCIQLRHLSSLANKRQR
jgi:hypothetical protein